MATGQTYKGTVNDVYGSNKFSVNLGYDVNATNATGLPIALGDTVEVTDKGRGMWEITRRITEHPPPVVPEPEPAPPKPAPTVPPAPTGAGSYNPPNNLGSVWNWQTGSSNAELLAGLNLIGSIHNGAMESILDELDKIETILNKAAADAVAARNAVRTTAQQLGGVADYAEDTGAAALEAVGASTDAAVKAGTIALVRDISIGSLPGKAGNIAGYATLQQANNPISLWLEHRVYWMGEIHAALNRALAYRGLALCPAIGTALWDMTSLGDNWSAIAGRWQANDDWFNNAANTMRPRIQALWTNEALGTPTYPSVTLAWSDRGTFAASREDAAASLRAHHSYYTAGLGTAVVKPIRIMNGQ